MDCCGNGITCRIAHPDTWTFLQSDVRDFRSLRVSQSLPALRRRRDGGRPRKRRRRDCVEARACSRNNRRLNLKRRWSEPLRDRERAWRRDAAAATTTSGIVAHAKMPMTTRIFDAADRERRNREYRVGDWLGEWPHREKLSIPFWLHENWRSERKWQIFFFIRAGGWGECLALKLDCTGSPQRFDAVSVIQYLFYSSFFGYISSYTI